MIGLSETSTNNVQIDINYKFLEAYRSSRTDGSIKYVFSIYLGEAIASSENTFLPFIVDVETKPEGTFFKIKGEIFVKGPREMVENLIVSRDNEPPEIWTRVYDEALKTLSSLADYIQVPPPL